jgi:hypothetical protein
MTQAFWRAAVLLVLFFLTLNVLVYLSVGRTRNGSVLRDFLQPPAGCPLPCWQGIRPGITSSLHAVDLLKALPWVTDLYSIQGIVASDSLIQWGWTGHQPDIVDSERDGQMWFHNGLVYEIDLPLRVTFTRVWDAFGRPEGVSTLITPLMPQQVSYRTFYFQQTVEIYGNTICPLNAYNLLDTRMDARIGEGGSVSYPIVKSPSVCGRSNS